jgi:hypothetical protein
MAKNEHSLEELFSRYALPGIVAVFLYRAFDFRLPSVEDLFITPEEQVSDALGDLNLQEKEAGRMPFVLTRSVLPYNKRLKSSMSFFDADEDYFDSGLGEAGLNYAPPVSSQQPPQRYGEYSNDERATSGSQQAPAREFSIWDSVANPKKQRRVSTRNASIRKPTRAHTSAASVDVIDLTSYVPTRGDSSMPRVLTPSASPAPFSKSEPGTDYTMLLVVGGLLAAFAASR